MLRSDASGTIFGALGRFLFLLTPPGVVSFRAVSSAPLPSPYEGEGMLWFSVIPWVLLTSYDFGRYLPHFSRATPL